VNLDLSNCLENTKLNQKNHWTSRPEIGYPPRERTPKKTFQKSKKPADHRPAGREMPRGDGQAED
ncbi:MAG TPA: hypothetical protein VGE17_05510, partial [Methylophilus sp.]